MKRRNFLKYSALVTGLGVAGARPGLAAPEGLPPGPHLGPPPGPPLPALDAMRRIGRLHLEARPDEIPDARAFLARIEAAGGIDRTVLRRLLAEEMRRDLDRAEVVVVDGWVLPRALVRACCSVSLA